MRWSYLFGQLIGRLEVEVAVSTPVSPREVHLNALSEIPGPPHGAVFNENPLLEQDCLSPHLRH